MEQSALPAVVIQSDTVYQLKRMLDEALDNKLFLTIDQAVLSLQQY